MESAVDPTTRMASGEEQAVESQPFQGEKLWVGVLGPCWGSGVGRGDKWGVGGIRRYRSGEKGEKRKEGLSRYENEVVIREGIPEFNSSPPPLSA